KFTKIKKKSWILLTITWITLIKTWAVTAMFGLFIFTIIMILNFNKNRTYLVYIGTLIGSIAITIFLVFFKLESNLVAEILLLFEKDLTFSTRDVLWMNAIDVIKQSILFGHGDLNNEMMKYY